MFVKDVYQFPFLETQQPRLRHSLKVSLPPQPPRPRAPGWRKRSKCPTIQRVSQTSVADHQPTMTTPNQRSHLNRSTKWQFGGLIWNDCRRKLELLMKVPMPSKRPSLILLKKTILSTFSSLTLFLLDILRWKAIKKEHYQYCSLYLIFVNFGTPPHYLGLRQSAAK